MGGIARRAKYIERFIDLKEPVVQVDAGDGFLRDRPPSSPLAEPEKAFALLLAKGAARLKVDAVNVGALDLAAGLPLLKELKQKAREDGELNLISSNLFDQTNSESIFDPEKIVERNGVKIGIFGLCRESDWGPKNLVVGDARASAKTMVEKLRKEKKVDLVVGLFNLGLEESKKICEEVPGIDIVVVSGASQYLWTPELQGRCILVQAGPGGKYLGQLELTYHPERGLEGKEPEAARLRDQLFRLNAQMSLLEGGIQNQEEARAKYLDLRKQRDRTKSELEKISLPFDYKHHLVPMDATLPVDIEIKKWIVHTLNSLKTAE